MLIDRRTIRAHMPWFCVAAVILLACVAWYVVEYLRSDPRLLPGGSTLAGFGIGIIAGLIFLFEFLYWPRRTYKIRAMRIGRAETWLRAHIWLGLITLPLTLIHSGFTTGGSFTTIFFLFFLVVYVSGLVGLLLQQIIPRLMLDELPEETIHSQIDSVLAQHLSDAERLVAQITGDETVFSSSASHEEVEEPLLVGSPRRLGTLRERVRYREDVSAAIPHTEALREALVNDIRPFLIARTHRDAKLGTPGKAQAYFAELRRRVPPDAHAAVDELEAICARQRQLRKQQRLYFWLHSWLTLHLPFSVALMILMLVHIVTALRYSGNPF